MNYHPEYPLLEPCLPPGHTMSLDRVGENGTHTANTPDNGHLINGLPTPVHPGGAEALHQAKMESLWNKLRSVAEEFCQETGLGVLLATSRRPPSRSQGEGGRGKEFYINLPSEEGDRARIEPEDCHRCCLQDSKSLIQKVALQTGGERRSSFASNAVQYKSEDIDEKGDDFEIKVEYVDKDSDHSIHNSSDIEAEFYEPKKRKKFLSAKAYAGELLDQGGGGGTYVCDSCGKVFPTLSACERHKKQYHGANKVYSCRTCKLKFTDYEEYTAHRKEHPAKRSKVICRFCGKGFSFRPHFRDHMRIHEEGENPFRCHVCSRELSSSEALRNHMLTHGEDKPYLCNICGRKFLRAANLTRHIKQLHTVQNDRRHRNSRGVRSGRKAFSKTFNPNLSKDEYTFNCWLCGDVFEIDNCLVHQAEHAADSGLKCVVCGKDCNDAADLEKHNRVHTVVHECNLCGKRLKSQAVLNVHMRIHTGEKPFKCASCGKEFSNQGNYIRHSKIHTGEKPYNCDTCGRTFVQSNTLKQHLLTHTGEKPWKCSICDAAYKEKRGLKKHMKTHMEDKNYLL